MRTLLLAIVIGLCLTLSQCRTPRESLLASEAGGRQDASEVLLHKTVHICVTGGDPALRGKVLRRAAKAVYAWRRALAPRTVSDELNLFRSVARHCGKLYRLSSSSTVMLGSDADVQIVVDQARVREFAGEDILFLSSQSSMAETTRDVGRWLFGMHRFHDELGLRCFFAGTPSSCEAAEDEYFDDIVITDTSAVREARIAFKEVSKRFGVNHSYLSDDIPDEPLLARSAMPEMASMPQLLPVILPGSEDSVYLPVEVQNGLYIHDDMVFHQHQQSGFQLGIGLPPNHVQLWPNATIPYIFDETVQQADRETILTAMGHWMSKVKVTFRPKRASDTYYIKIDYQPEGLWSSGRATVGRSVGGMYQVTPFVSLYIALHELGHTLGLQHEQQRSDRDSYIRINWDSVIPEAQRAYAKLPDLHHYGDFDYDSIMLYGGTTHVETGRTISSASEISSGDVEAVRRMYGLSYGGHRELPGEVGLVTSRKQKREQIVAWINRLEGRGCMRVGSVSYGDPKLLDAISNVDSLFSTETVSIVSINNATHQVYDRNGQPWGNRLSDDTLGLFPNQEVSITYFRASPYYICQLSSLQKKVVLHAVSSFPSEETVLQIFNDGEYQVTRKNLLTGQEAVQSGRAPTEVVQSVVGLAYEAIERKDAIEKIQQRIVGLGRIAAVSVAVNNFSGQSVEVYNQEIVGDSGFGTFMIDMITGELATNVMKAVGEIGGLPMLYNFENNKPQGFSSDYVTGGTTSEHLGRYSTSLDCQRRDSLSQDRAFLVVDRKSGLIIGGSSARGLALDQCRLSISQMRYGMVCAQDNLGYSLYDVFDGQRLFVGEGKASFSNHYHDGFTACLDALSKATSQEVCVAFDLVRALRVNHRYRNTEEELPSLVDCFGRLR